jgi:hypothetical protein
VPLLSVEDAVLRVEVRPAIMTGPDATVMKVEF